MRDRQYLLSLAAFAVIAGGLLCGVLLFLRWAGWQGALGLAAPAGLFLTWFYGGPRPDLQAKGRQGTGRWNGK